MVDFVLKILRILTKNYQKCQIFETQKMQNDLKGMQNQFSEFCDYLFLRYSRFVLKILSDLGTLITASATLCEPDS